MRTRTWMTMLLASLMATGWAHHASAQPALAPIQETDEPSTRRDVEYYGWQILAVDATSVIAAIAIGQLDGNIGGVTFVGGYVLGGPLVHLGHGNRGRALGSAALRVGLPALGFALPLLADANCNEDGDCDDLARGLAALTLGALGMGVATVLDWTVLGLSIEEAPAERGPTLVPQVSAGADGSLQLGVLGRF